MKTIQQRIWIATTILLAGCLCVALYSMHRDRALRSRYTFLTDRELAWFSHEVDDRAALVQHIQIYVHSRADGTRWSFSAASAPFISETEFRAMLTKLASQGVDSVLVDSGPSASAAAISETIDILRSSGIRKILLFRMLEGVFYEPLEYEQLEKKD